MRWGGMVGGLVRLVGVVVWLPDEFRPAGGQKRILILSKGDSME
jgi:hypothetical protein